MDKQAEMQPHRRQALRKIVPSLAVNWLVPLILYSLLRSHVATDTAALAISGAIPALWVVAQTIGARRIDWIGVLGIAGFGAACLISALSGGGSLPLKLYHPAVACLIGLAALVSAAAKKPLALLLLRALQPGMSGRFDHPAVRRKFAQATVVFGIIFLIDGAAHAVMAFTLSTGAFLVASRVVTLAALAVLVLVVRRILWRKQAG